MKKFPKILLSIGSLSLLFTFANAGKIWLEPSEGQFISKCPFEINVMMDTEGIETNTVGVSFYIDDTVFALNDLNTVGGVFPAYTSFVRGKAWHGDKKGQQTISFMGTTAQKEGFKGQGKIATIKMLSLLGVNSIDLNLYAIPGFSADDSNINYSSGNEIADALVEAIGGKYTFVDGECPAYQTPVIISEDDQVILKTQSKDFVFAHQMPFFKRIGNFIGNNIKIVIIGLLILAIVLLLLKKNNEKNNKDNKKENDKKDNNKKIK